jgi:uncharacterized protein YfaT (DUF1175 family)
MVVVVVVAVTAVATVVAMAAVVVVAAASVADRRFAPQTKPAFAGFFRFDFFRSSFCNRAPHARSFTA